MEANTGKAKAELDRFNRGLDDKSIKVTATIDKSSFAGAEVAKKALGKNESFKLKADIDASNFARARAVVSAFNKETSGMGAIFDRSRLSYGQLGQVIAATLPVIVDAAGALTALTASAAAATAGLGALAIGMAGMATVGFGGIIAIAAPALSSLKDLRTAQEAHNKAVTTGAASAGRASSASAQQIKSAQEQVATATRGVTVAEQQLHTAQASETLAQKALTAARKEAVRQLQDMRRAAIEGATSEKRAQLSIEQAEKNLRDVRLSSTSTALDIRDAELSVTEARQSAKDIALQAQRAEQDYNKAQKRGLDQMPGVVSAQQSLVSATQGVTAAQQGVAQAHRDVAKATQNLAFQQKQANMATAAGGTSLAALALAQKKAGPAAVKFAKNLKGIGQEWKSLTKVGRSDFFGMLNDGLRRTEGMLPMFAKSANKSMHALRGGFDQFLDKATGPEFKTFIHTMTDTFAKSMKPIAAGFANIGIVLERIAVAVAPDLLRMFKGFREMTQGWVDSTRNAKDLEDTVHGLVNQANAWWKLIKATAGLIAAVLVPGMGQGKKAVEGITASLKGWTAWVEGHPEAMRGFFKEGLKTTSQLFEVLAGFLPMIFQVSKAMRPIARLFLGIVKGLNSIKVGNISALTVLLGAVVGAKLISGIGSVVGAFGRLKVAALGAATAEKAAVSVPLGAGTSAKTVTGGVIGSTGTTGGRFARTKSIARGIGAAAIGTAVISGIFDAFDDKGLQRSFGSTLRDFFHGATFGLVQGSKEVASEVAQTWADVISRIRPGGVIPEDAASTILAAGKVKGLTDATLALVRIRSQLLPQLVREGSLTQDQADALAKYAKQQERVLRNSQEFMSGRSKGLGFAHALAQDKKLTGDEVADILRKLSELPKGARKEAANTMIGMAKVMEDKGDLPKGSAKGLRDTVVQTYHGMNVKSVKESGKMAKGVAMNAGALVSAVTAGLDILKGNVQKSLKAFGVKALKFTLQKPGKAGGALGSFVGAFTGQRGGHIPGAGDGDKVPAMLEAGEFVVNKKATKAHRKALEKMNFRDAPRFRGGGVVDRTGVQHLAKGGTAGGALNFALGPETIPPIQYDANHAGANSHVHITGTTTPWVVAIGKKLQKMGFTVGEFSGPASAGFGPITAQHSATGGHYDALAIDVNSAADETHAEVASIARLLKSGKVSGAAAIEKLKRVILKGPDGPLKDMGQGALDKTWKAANAFLAKQTPKVTGGVNLAGLKGPWVKVMKQIAEQKGWNFGDWMKLVQGESGGNPEALNPTSGAFGLGQFLGATKAAYAKYGATSHDPAKQIQAMAKYISDRYGSPTSAYNQWLSRSPHWYKKGGVVEPYVGSFARGGEVAKDGLAKVHKGEHVTPKHQPHQKFGPIPGLKQLLKVLRLAAFGRHAEHRLEVLRDKKHLTLEQRSEKRDLQRRKQEARLARQLRHGAGGPGAIQKALKALAKSRVHFSPKAERKLEDLQKQRRHHNLDRGERRQLHNLEDRKAESKRDDKIEKRLRDRLALEKELIAEYRTLSAELKEHNKLARTIRANEKAALNAVVNLTASQIGAQGMQKGRNASPGRAVRY